MLASWEKWSSLEAWRPNLRVLKIGWFFGDYLTKCYKQSQTLSQCSIQLGGVSTRQAGYGRLSKKFSEKASLNIKQWAVRSTICGTLIILRTRYWKYRNLATFSRLWQADWWLTANTEFECDETFVDLTRFIEAKPPKRGFLRVFINFGTADSIILAMHSNLGRLQKLI